MQRLPDYLKRPIIDTEKTAVFDISRVKQLAESDDPEIEELVNEAQQKYDNIVAEENKVREERERQLQEMQEKDNEINIGMTASEDSKAE